ncbi:MAG: hypothetical protein ACOYOS_03675 [Syntrophales bacterium]
MMEKTEDLSKIEGENNSDHGLSEELESLYHRVARLDQPDATVENGSAARGDDKKAGTAPYQNPQNPQNQEELMEKLMAIKEAYERLLTYWPFARERPPDFL